MNTQGHCPQEAPSMRATVRSVSDKVKGKRATHKVLWEVRRKNELLHLKNVFQIIKKIRSYMFRDEQTLNLQSYLIKE